MGNSSQEWRLCRITGKLVDKRKYAYTSAGGEGRECLQIRVDTTTDEDRARGFYNTVVLHAYKRAIGYAEKFNIGDLVDVWFNPVSRPVGGTWDNVSTILIATNIYPSALSEPEDGGNRFDGFNE